jgi:hypothetical protein
MLTDPGLVGESLETTPTRNEAMLLSVQGAAGGSHCVHHRLFSGRGLTLVAPRRNGQGREVICTALGMGTAPVTRLRGPTRFVPDSLDIVDDLVRRGYFPALRGSEA